MGQKSFSKRTENIKFTQNENVCYVSALSLAFLLHFLLYLKMQINNKVLFYASDVSQN